MRMGPKSCRELTKAAFRSVRLLGDVVIKPTLGVMFGLADSRGTARRNLGGSNYEDHA